MTYTQLNRLMLQGVESLAGIKECCVVSEPTQEKPGGAWLIPVSLHIEEGNEFIPKESHWIIRVEESYPYGDISVLPAKKNSVVATFQHQSRNRDESFFIPYRTGKICLTASFANRFFALEKDDPIGDAEVRLRWHVLRSIEWLSAATRGDLVQEGDPFELPQMPSSKVAYRDIFRIVYEESAANYDTWKAQEGNIGFAYLANLDCTSKTAAVTEFTDFEGNRIHSWTGRSLASSINPSIKCFWSLWPKPIVLEPWQYPATWQELIKSGILQGINIAKVAGIILERMRKHPCSCILLLGFPMLKKIGGKATEIHWNAIFLPKTAITKEPPRGFRHNKIGANQIALKYIETENWHPTRLQARGRIEDQVLTKSIAVIGLGAIGSVLCEVLARTGVKSFALFDPENIEAGNVSRHVCTLKAVGQNKAEAIKERILEINPHARVTAYGTSLPNTADDIYTALDDWNIVIDCTGTDLVLELLSLPWWAIPKHFFSISVGYKAKRLFIYSSCGNRLDIQKFKDSIKPWLSIEKDLFAEDDEYFEGIGCWSPIFPARFDDILQSVSMSVKVIEKFIKTPLCASELIVYEFLSDTQGFQSFSVVTKNA